MVATGGRGLKDHGLVQRVVELLVELIQRTQSEEDIAGGCGGSLLTSKTLPLSGLRWG